MKKRQSKAFGKDIYLLGRDSDGQNVWLKSPSWDCGWYWGFGYVERYTNNNDPAKARDISSHTHISSEFTVNGAIDLNDSSILKEKTFTNEDGKHLNELFTQFYYLRKESDKVHNNNTDRYNEINKVSIPSITDKIIELLKP